MDCWGASRAPPTIWPPAVEHRRGGGVFTGQPVVEARETPDSSGRDREYRTQHDGHLVRGPRRDLHRGRGSHPGWLGAAADAGRQTRAAAQAVADRRTGAGRGPVPGIETPAKTRIATRRDLSDRGHRLASL